MAEAVHHTTVLTVEAQRVVDFARTVLDMPVLFSFAVPRSQISSLFGWPDAGDQVSSVLLGRGSCGLLEVVQAPEDVVRAGIPATNAQLALVVPDLGQALRAAAAAGADELRGPVIVSVGGRDSSVAVVRVAGIAFQLSGS